MTYLEKLHELGYSSKFRVVPEAASGAPQVFDEPEGRFGIVAELRRAPGVFVECFAEGHGRVFACKSRAATDTREAAQVAAEVCFRFIFEHVLAGRG